MKHLSDKDGLEIMSDEIVLVLSGNIIFYNVFLGVNKFMYLQVIMPTRYKSIQILSIWYPVNASIAYTTNRQV